MTTEPKFFSRHEDREGVRPPTSAAPSAPTKPLGFLDVLLVICLLPFVLIWLLAAAGRAAAKARERDGPRKKKPMGTLEKVAWGGAAIYFLHAFWSDRDY